MLDRLFAFTRHLRGNGQPSVMRQAVGLERYVLRPIYIHASFLQRELRYETRLSVVEERGFCFELRKADIRYVMTFAPPQSGAGQRFRVTVVHHLPSGSHVAAGDLANANHGVDLIDAEVERMQVAPNSLPTFDEWPSQMVRRGALDQA